MNTGTITSALRRARHAAGGVAALAALALLVSGCVPAPDEGESIRLAGAFPEVYSQTIDWGACTEDFDLTDDLAQSLTESGAKTETFECAMVLAPFDWNVPENADTIELAVARVPSSGAGERLGSLLTNPGGPGEGGLTTAYGFAGDSSIAPVLASYDLVGFDPRGIGRSAPLDCVAESTIMELNIAKCVEDSPLALSIGTTQVAKDMDLLRSLLGDDSLHYLGYSYGTALGATYATLFPERVGRMVLDGPSPSNWASPIDAFDQTVAIVHEMNAMLTGCGTLYEASECPLSNDQDLLATMETLTEEPLLASDGTELDGKMLYGLLVSALYQPMAGREVALDRVAAALAGDQKAVDSIVREMASGGSWVSLTGKIVQCHSFPQDPGIAPMLAHIEEVGMPEFLGGPEISDLTLRQFVDLSCDAMPGSGDDYLETFTGSPDAPILVVGISGDHATPYAGAVQMEQELGNARLVKVEGVGHGASYFKDSPCVDGIATAYLLEGTLPPEGTVCTLD